MKEDVNNDDLIYLRKKPNVLLLKKAYDDTINDLETYFNTCRRSYDDRRNWWPGKNDDLKKHGADAFPWDGASDLEAHVIDERITRLVSLFLSALNRSNIRAFPVEISDQPRSEIVSSFLKWMTSSGYIPRFNREMELGANYLLERGLLITYVGWNREDRRFLQKVDFNSIAESAPEIANAIQAGGNDEDLISLLRSAFPNLDTKRAKAVIKDLRELGVAEIPVIRRQVDAPDVKTLSPNGDFFFPSYVSDPQRAPYCFWKTYYTAQELKGKVLSDNWDEDFVDYAIENLSGTNLNHNNNQSYSYRTNSNVHRNDYSDTSDLIEIIHCYQRLVDDDDGAEGIYETVFNPKFSGTEFVQGYAKFELLNGYEDYPIVVTRLLEDTKNMYDVQTVPSLLRGIQCQVKIERDSRIDRNSLATVPPIFHIVGNAPSGYGPARLIPIRRKGDIEFGPTPPYNPGSIEMENTQLDQADRLVGLDENSNLGQLRRQFLVDKFLMHVAEVLRMCYRNFQRFGPDHLFFRVTGSPDPVRFNKGDPDENFDILINFDVLSNDSDKIENKINQFLSLLQLDKNANIDINSLISVLANSIDPVLADAVLRSQNTASEDIVKKVTDDLAKIYSGIEVPAQPNGAEIALQVIQEYVNQPDIAQMMQQNESFANRINKYADQYKFSLQQQHNAQVGKIGTDPSSVGNIETQGL